MVAGVLGGDRMLQSGCFMLNVFSRLLPGVLATVILPQTVRDLAIAATLATLATLPPPRGQAGITVDGFDSPTPPEPDPL